MSLTERHRWCMNKILEAFSPELTVETAQAFIRNDTNLQKFNAFFRGDLSGRLFIYFQPIETLDGEVSMRAEDIYSLFFSFNIFYLQIDMD